MQAQSASEFRHGGGGHLLAVSLAKSDVPKQNPERIEKLAKGFRQCSKRLAK